MKNHFLVRAILAAFALLPLFGRAAEKPIPEPLKAWEAWATWGDEHRLCPTPYSDAKKHLCFWPSRLGLQAEPGGGKFDFVVTVFHETWVPLPGNAEVWPLEVKANGAPLPVLEHDGAPSVRLAAGTFRLEGSFRWNDIPQRLRVPPQIGILALVIAGQPVEAPVWDAQGSLWLKRDGSTEEADKNFLAVKLYAALEDGSPLWLRTEIELTVSGQSREEDLGTILPEGWKLAAVEGPIPAAVDAAGRMKVQVRAGKWTLQADAFRFDNPKEFRYAEGAKPAVAEQLVAFRARPDFRIVEITGALSIDVSQTTFPDKWRELPVYRWETATPFRLEERMRGMGEQKPAGLTIARELWLDENGRGLTFRDQITGAMQQIWRLDAAAGQDLGSVRSGGQGQLITRNPQNDAPGVEIRTRNLNLEATGRMTRAQELPATGWRSDADALRVTLNLPPGWRLFALSGADWVRGDWLTAWTLLDLFLLLIFSLAVFRLWGIGPGLLAFLAFGLSYHEAGAPRYLWLLLLIPLALQRVVPNGRGRRVLGVGKWFAIGTFVFALVPFVAQQVQQALYPQLEVVRGSEISWAGINDPRARPADATPDAAGLNVDSPAPMEQVVQQQTRESSSYGFGVSRVSKKRVEDNLQFDAKARIQTGPGVPEWKWREVSFGWNGPVAAAQQVKPVLISLTLERVFSVLRVVLLLTLAAVLLGARKWSATLLSARAKIVAAAVVLTVSGANANGRTTHSHESQKPPLLFLGLDRETRLREMPIERERLRQAALPHQREGGAVGERPALVGVFAKKPPGCIKKSRVHVHQFDPSTCEQGRADLNRRSVLVTPIQKCGDFVENKRSRHQRIRRCEKRAPVRPRRRMVLIARQRQRDEETRIEKGESHSVEIAVVIFGGIGQRDVHRVQVEAKDWIVCGILAQATQLIDAAGLFRRFHTRGDHDARPVRQMDAGRQLDRVVFDDGGDAHARTLGAARKAGKRAAFGHLRSLLTALLLCIGMPLPAQAQVPDQATLDKLRERLLEVSDAFPHAADIPSVALTLSERKITIDAHIHAAVRTAVPLPGRLPAWSPLAVFVDDKPEVALRRDDGYLWLVLEAGVHRVRVEGSLANVTEWEWTFLLKPRQVKIDAPGWTITGVKPEGVPEAQVFFARQQKAAAGAASYDRQEVQTIVAIDRHLELGLVWQVRTTVTRLSPLGKAVALRVPLLPGENVFSSNATVKDGFIEVRLGAQEPAVSWESGLAVVNTLKLATRAEDAWVERWHLVVSPVWNVAISGLAPIYETDVQQPTTTNDTIRAGGGDLIPVWQPWPGESAELTISRPEALAGATVTVSRGTHEITLGKRQRTSKLDLSLRCSLGEDFLVDLPEDAEITTLAHQGKAIPVRKDGRRLIIPVRPGEQTISIAWKTNAPLGAQARVGEVRLPVESANLQTIVNVPADRWVLWADGPRRGPAVRFWGILVCSLLAALVLGRLAGSPIHTLEWMLLAIGLTQVPLLAALAVVGWLFFLGWRGSAPFQRLRDYQYNALQVVLLALTVAALGILLTAVGEGLLGSPEMFITGNGSTRSVLRWFQARSESLLPRPGCLSISIWWYRFLMLAWALWLAAALLRWLRRGWQAFSSGGAFRTKPKVLIVPPPLPQAVPPSA